MFFYNSCNIKKYKNLTTNTDISIVIPLLNEEESLPELVEWIARVMDDNSYSYEIILIDDGSTDNSWNIIEELSTKNPSVKGVKFNRNYGKSAALNIGFKEVTGKVVFTMDADLQDSPDELPDLYKMITEDGYDLVSGWKKKRYDPITKTVPTKLFNGATRLMSGVKLHDFNCGLKAYKNEVVKNIDVYGEMHRYIPFIAKFNGYSKIGEKEVIHQERKYGVTKFGLERFIFGFLDLMSISFTLKFKRRPMHFFGSLGTITFFLGLSIFTYLGVDKIIIDTSAKLIADRTEFYLALTCMIMGSQMFLAGYIGEMISINSSKRDDYNIAKKLKL